MNSWGLVASLSLIAEVQVSLVDGPSDGSSVSTDDAGIAALAAPGR